MTAIIPSLLNCFHQHCLWFWQMVFVDIHRFKQTLWLWSRFRGMVWGCLWFLYCYHHQLLAVYVSVSLIALHLNLSTTSRCFSNQSEKNFSFTILCARPYISQFPSPPIKNTLRPPTVMDFTANIAGTKAIWHFCLKEETLILLINF